MRISCLAATGMMLGGCASAAEISCVKELELPRFATAGRSPSGGTVVAKIELEGGYPRINVRSRPKDKSLEAEVKYHLSERAKYKTSCTGQMELSFTFAVEGESSYTPVTRVFFKPPNAFVIVTQPLRMSIDAVPRNN